jgi:hypothetical protein
MGLSLVVGLISGLGAVVFFVACQFGFHYTLNQLAGYDPCHRPTSRRCCLKSSARGRSCPGCCWRSPRLAAGLSFGKVGRGGRGISGPCR